MSRHILVVDDDHDILELTRTCLEAVGRLSVETASSGLDALRILETGKLPDAILLDVMMPGLDGLSLVRRLRQSDHTRDLPVVLLTAKDLSRDRDPDQLDQLGIRGTLSKPYDPMRLPAQVTQLLGWDDEGAS